MFRALWNKENRGIFYRTLSEKNKAGDLVELVLRLEHPDRKVIESELTGKIGPVQVEYFEFIPYASLKVPVSSAYLLAGIVSTEGFLLTNDRTPVISDVDVSHRVSIPDEFEHLSVGMRALADQFKKMHLQKAIYKMDGEDGSEPSENMWNLRNVMKYEAERSWYQIGQSARVAIIDTGCDYTHSEIRDRFNPNNLGYNFCDKNTNPKDGNRHGTHVAGSTAGMMVGVAPYANLFAVKVLNDEGSGTETDVIRGIEWCIRNEMDVGNMSLGASAASEAFEKICKAARERGLILVAAAGNSYIGKSYPAAFDSVISVAAVDRDKAHAEFSNVNNCLDVSAPGVKVFSCVPGGGYDTFSGTSMASPHATGAIAAGLSVEKPRRNSSGVDYMADLLKETCYPCQSTGSPYADRWLYGAGHIDVQALMSRVNEGF